MGVLIFLFWISLAVLFYCFFGYSLLVFLFRITGLFKRNAARLTQAQPGVTLVVTAYLEDRILEQKIEPTSALSICGAVKYLKESPQDKNRKILAIISGGNIN